MTVSLPSPPNILADGKCTVRFVERDGVIAVLAERLDQAGVGDRGCPALDGYGARVDENASGRVAAGRDRVVEIVAGRRQRAAPGLKVLETAIVTILSKLALGTDAPQP
jgi:hypothetical protein